MKTIVTQEERLNEKREKSIKGTCEYPKRTEDSQTWIYRTL
jgi:hypothetical protein